MHWQTLAWPFRTTALFALFSYALLAFAGTAWADVNFWVGVLVLTLGAPAWYGVFGALSLYARKLFNQAALGLFEEAIDSETEINPFIDGRGFKICVVHLAVFVLYFYNGPDPSWLLVLPGLLLPLFWLSLMLDDALFSAFQLEKLGRILGGLNVFYPLLIVLVSGSLFYLHHTLLYNSSLLHIVLSALAFLFANVLSGSLVYTRRRALDLATLKSPEQTLAEALEAEQRSLDQLLHEIHTHIGAGSFATAVQKLEAFVAEDPETLDPFIHERLKEFQDERLLLEHGVRYLQRLADRGETRKAWTLMKACLVRDELFRPFKDETLLALTRAAGREDVGVVDSVLADFARAYPESTHVP
ncbi:MAG: hypothetical protein AAGE43_20690, partial [Pseudomonadota bacterium]